MKLIRLVTNDENAVFDNTFNEDILLKSNSKIALQSVSLETQNNIIEIDSSNDKITFEYSTGYAIDITLEHQQYTSLNYRDLLNDIKNKLNSQVGYDAAVFPVLRSFGLEFNVAVNQQRKIGIGYQIGASNEYVDEWNYTSPGVRRFNQGGRQVWEATIDAAGANTASCLFDTFVSRGCGFIRTRTHKYENNLGVAPENNGYIIGLSRTDLSGIEPADVTNAMLTYGIAVSCDNANVRKYYTVEDGVYTERGGTVPNFNGVGDVDNDFQEVIINFNQVEFNVYQNGSDAKVALTTSVNYTPDEKLYPFFLFRAPNASLNSLRVTPSPYGAVTINAVQETAQLSAPPPPQRNPSDNVLTFGAQSLAEFLGYQNTRHPRVGTVRAVQHTFNAGLVFEPTDVADAFLVEMLNLKCESYDGLKNQRKNILAVIPKSNITGDVIYETNTPFFIDLNNAKDILLRNIKIRITRPDYSEINIFGTATMVLLIDDGN